MEISGLGISGSTCGRSVKSKPSAKHRHSDIEDARTEISKLSTGAAESKTRDKTKSRFRLTQDVSESDLNPVLTGKKVKVKATRVWRPKEWDWDVEENHRLQAVGWKDIYEYESFYGKPDRWENELIKCLRVKKTGYYTYWSKERECFDKDVHRVKLYEYEDGQETKHK